MIKIGKIPKKVVKLRGGVKPTQVHKVKTKYTRKDKHKKNLTIEQGDNYEKTIEKKP